NAKSTFITGKINAHVIEGEIENKAIIEKNGSLNANTILTLKCGDIRHYGSLASKGVAFLDIKKKALFFEKSSIKADKKLHIDCDTARNHGKLESEADLIFRSNKYFIHGANLYDIRSAEDLEKLLTIPTILAKNVHIIAGAYLNVGGFVNGTSMQVISSLAGVEFLALNKAFLNMKNIIISVDLSIDIPDLAPVKEIFYKLINCEFESILNDYILTKATLFQTVSMLINSLKLIYPHAGMFASAVWNTTLITLSAPRIYNEISGLYNNWENVQLRDVIPVIVGIKNTLLQATTLTTSTITMVNQFKSQGVILDNRPPLSWNDLIQTGEMVASVVGPSISRDAVINVNAGVDITINDASRSVVSTQASIQLAQNVNQTSVFAVQENFTRANTVMQQGVELVTGSNVRTNNYYAEYANNIDQEANGKIDANKVTIMANDVNESGQIHAKVATVNISGQHHVAAEGKYSQDGGQYKAGTTQLGGNMQVENSKMETKHLNIEQSAHLKVSESVTNTDEYRNNGKADMSHVEFSVSNRYQTTATSSNSLDNMAIKANDALIGGINNLDNVTAQAANGVTFGQGASINTHNTVGMECKHFVQESGNVNMDNNSQLIVKADQQIDLNAGSHIHGTQGE
ncbi:MAG: hypothetical protein ACK4PR_11695, partial [Gammaproteobacteria bacterium]